MIHVVPAVPPAVNGLGSYCYKLWEQWPGSSGGERPVWRCLAPEVPGGAHEHWPEVEIESFAPSANGLWKALERLEDRTLILHYAGYGFAPKGSPVWLPSALRRWKRERGRRLIVMFHELYSPGRRWSSSFWLYPVARRIVRTLVSEADAWLTSCPEYHQKLIVEAGADAARGAMLPIGADITPQQPIDNHHAWPLATGRGLKIVVFGQPNTRLWSLTAHQNLLRELFKRDLIQSVLLLGSCNHPNIEAETRKLCARIETNEACWIRRHDLSPAELSAEFASCDLGLVANHPGILTKSLVYAALCQHGVLPVCRAAPESDSVRGDGTNETERPWPAGLANDDTDPEACVRILCDAEFVARERERVRNAAENDLDWQRITGHWAKIVKKVEAS